MARTAHFNFDFIPARALVQRPLPLTAQLSPQGNTYLWFGFGFGHAFSFFEEASESD